MSGYQGKQGGGGGDFGGRGGGGGGRGGRGGGADSAVITKGNCPPLSSFPTVDAKTLPLQDLGKGAVMPLLFGGNRTTKPVELQVAAKKGVRTEKEKQLAVESAEKRREEAEETRKKVDAAIENVKALKGSPPPANAEPIRVNCFPLKCDLRSSFYQYQVICNPEIPNRRRRKDKVEQALKQAAQKYKAPTPILTNNVVFAVKPIHDSKGNDKAETVKLVAGEKTLEITFKFTRTFDNSKGLSTETYGVLSTVIREAFDLAGMVKISGKYFDTNEKYAAAHIVQSQGSAEALLISQGLNITLYPTSRGLMLNADLAMRISRKDSALVTINSCKKFAAAKGYDFKEVIKSEIVGSIAATTYSINSKKQTLTVADVRFDVNPGSPIPGDKNKTTFAKYMSDHHGLKVSDMTQPMILFRSTREVDREGNPIERWYIPEFVQMVGQSAQMRNNSALQQDMKRACLLSAEERFSMIAHFMSKVAADSNFQALLQQWQMNLSPAMTICGVKRFDVPALTFKVDQNRRAWNCTGAARPVPSNAVPNQWAVVHPDRLSGDQLGNFLSTLNQECGKLKLSLPQPQIFTYRSDRDPGRWGKNMANTLNELGEDIRFVLVVLNDNNDGNYYQVKEMSLKDWEIPSQCVLIKNATTSDPRKLSNIASRLAGQIVVKLGGALWATVQPVQGSEGILLLGLSSASAKACTALSIVAARAEDNLPIATYASTYSGDATKAIETGINTIVASYKKKSGNAPKAIFVYRPGMNEGDVPNIIANEVIPTQKVCADQKIALVFINALKRCSIRFMPSPAGSLIDDYLMPTSGFTFLMVPQHVTQGCATAMKFSVLANSSPNITADLIERLTQQQTSAYFGWWGSTREPAVVMYAERQAEMHAKTDAKNKKLPYIDSGAVRVL